jgi:type I restriction enzyme S subunit
MESTSDRLATIPALLKKFRQSVLAAAYDCSILLPLGETIVTECSLGDIIRKIEAGKSFKAEGHPPRNGVPGVIKVSAMTWGRFNPLESKQLIPGTKPNPATEIQSGDLLFSRANTEELVGATVLVEATPPNLFLSDKSLRLVPVERICKRWLNAALSSPQVRDHFAEIATGTSNSMRNISQSKLLRTPILLPEFEDQKRIADRVESLFALADSIESRLADATAQVERTTQAILAKAFRGEL